MKRFVKTVVTVLLSSVMIAVVVPCVSPSTGVVYAADEVHYTSIGAYIDSLSASGATLESLDKKNSNPTDGDVIAITGMNWRYYRRLSSWFPTNSLETAYGTTLATLSKKYTNPKDGTATTIDNKQWTYLASSERWVNYIPRTSADTSAKGVVLESLSKQYPNPSNGTIAVADSKQWKFWSDPGAWFPYVEYGLSAKGSVLDTINKLNLSDSDKKVVTVDGLNWGFNSVTGEWFLSTLAERAVGDTLSTLRKNNPNPVKRANITVSTATTDMVDGKHWAYIGDWVCYDPDVDFDGSATGASLEALNKQYPHLVDSVVCRLGDKYWQYASNADKWYEVEPRKEDKASGYALERLNKLYPNPEPGQIIYIDDMPHWRYDAANNAFWSIGGPEFVPTFMSKAATGDTLKTLNSKYVKLANFTIATVDGIRWQYLIKFDKWIKYDEHRISAKGAILKELSKQYPKPTGGEIGMIASYEEWSYDKLSHKWYPYILKPYLEITADLESAQTGTQISQVLNKLYPNGTDSEVVYQDNRYRYSKTDNTWYGVAGY